MALQPCVACGCFVREGATTCPHCDRSASTLGRTFVHASLVAMVGAATACVSTPVYGYQNSDGTVTSTAETGDTGATESSSDAETTTDTGTP